MEITFENPIYLWALLIVPVLIVIYFISLKYSRAIALKFANFVAISRISQNVGESYNLIGLTIRVMAVVFIILSISGLVIWYTGQISVSDYAIAVDASASMSQKDFSPSRLEAAKLAANAFVESLPFNSYAAVISFSGASFVEQPLTNKKSDIQTSINSINLSNIGGTDFGDAIITSINLLTPSKKARAVVLLTDGWSNIGVSKESAVSYALQNHATIYTIGIGSKDMNLSDLNLGVDEDSLKYIAEMTGGNYYYVNNEEDLKTIYTNLSKERKIGQNPINLSFVLLVAALILLVFDWFLGSTIYRRIA